MKRASRLLATLLLLLTAGSLQAGSDSGFFFKSGDRIVFLGDSITEQYQYSTDIELYLTTRFPKWNLTFINAGIGGDTANGGAHRFTEHVLAEKPTAVTIDFGMNDGGYGGFKKGQNTSDARYTEAMLDAAKKADVRVALISPNAVDRRTRSNLKQYFETQKEFYAPLKDIAARFDVPFVDQYARTRNLIEKLEQDKATRVNPFPDGVHTSSSGGLLMAYTILTGLHASALVSNLEIDAGSKAAKTEQCKIDKLAVSSSGVAFTRTDEALPLPVQGDWSGLLPYVNQLKDLNWYGLKETSLPSGKYTMSIDGKKVAAYSAEELAAGVNLGNLTKGAIHDQGQLVFKAIDSKNKLVHQRFRSVVMFNAPDWLADVAAERKPAELAKRMKAIDERQAEIYKLVQPVAHEFELKQEN